MDIEEDINILENLKKYLNLLIYEGTHKIIYNDLDWDEKTIDCINAIDHILAEREEDKKKIAELEKENHKILENGIDVIRDSIAKQTVRDKIKELKNNLKYIACNEDCSKCFNQEGKALYRESNFVFCFAYHQIKVLQQLLEDQ